jgi:protein SCO1/2
MKSKRIMVFTLFLVIALPFGFYLLFQPLGKIKRPKAPAKQYGIGVVERLNARGEKFYDSVYHVIPNYKFQTQSGDSLELDSLRGSIYVANFFFASCPGICPVMNAQMKRVQGEFIRDKRVKLVSFTVDPDRDSILALRDYARDYDAIPGKWFFLRGSKHDIYNVAADGFKVVAKETPGEGEAGFVHSERLVLIDPQGNIRAWYDGTDSARVKKLMGDVVLLLGEADRRR